MRACVGVFNEIIYRMHGETIKIVVEMLLPGVRKH
jgi:hypothetical protein